MDKTRELPPFCVGELPLFTHSVRVVGQIKYANENSIWHHTFSIFKSSYVIEKESESSLVSAQCANETYWCDSADAKSAAIKRRIITVIDF